VLKIILLHCHTGQRQSCCLLGVFVTYMCE